MRDELPNILNHALVLNNLNFSVDKIDKLIRYLELMHQWNRIYNLTTIMQPFERVYLHLIDSLVVLPYLQGERCLDVGTGAGLPGIPLAIVNPDKYWILLDKNSKKTRFLTQVVAELQLGNVEVMHSRSENFHPAFCFDSIVSRALGTLDMFLQTTEHLVCADGCFLALKGKYPQNELNDLPKGYKTKIIRLEIKGIVIERHLVCIKREN